MGRPRLNPPQGDLAVAVVGASILAELEVAIQAATARSDQHSYGVLNGVAVGAGALKHKADEAAGLLTGDDAALVGRLGDLL